MHNAESIDSTEKNDLDFLKKMQFSNKSPPINRISRATWSRFYFIQPSWEIFDGYLTGMDISLVIQYVNSADIFSAGNNFFQSNSDRLTRQKPSKPLWKEHVMIGKHLNMYM